MSHDHRFESNNNMSRECVSNTLTENCWVVIFKTPKFSFHFYRYNQINLIQLYLRLDGFIIILIAYPENAMNAIQNDYRGKGGLTSRPIQKHLTRSRLDRGTWNIGLLPPSIKNPLLDERNSYLMNFLMIQSSLVWFITQSRIIIYLKSSRSRTIRHFNVLS